MMYAFAKVLNIPEDYFYTIDDGLSEYIIDIYLK